MTMVLSWRVPAPAVTTGWRGPDGRVLAALQDNPASPIAGVIGPKGETGATIMRVQQIGSAASITPDADITDLVDITALAVAASIEAPSGEPQNGARLMFRIKDAGTSRSLSWAGAYASGGLPLPSATVPGKTMHLGFLFNSNTAKWALIASLTEA